MARTLDVYLHRDLVGHLMQDDYGQMSFDYTESWRENPAAMPLSHSLPLRNQRFTRKECSGFFGGILPEQNPREIVAKNLGISAKNDFAMLEQIGGECAGAVTFLPAGEPLPEREDRYRDLSDKELVDMLKTLPAAPAARGRRGCAAVACRGAGQGRGKSLRQQNLNPSRRSTEHTHSETCKRSFRRSHI